MTDDQDQPQATQTDEPDAQADSLDDTLAGEVPAADGEGAVNDIEAALAEATKLADDIETSIAEGDADEDAGDQAAEARQLADEELNEKQSTGRVAEPAPVAKEPTVHPLVERLCWLCELANQPLQRFSRKFRTVLGFVGLSLIAVAVAIMVFSWVAGTK